MIKQNKYHLLHGNIPLENLAAYFNVRVIYGYTQADWR